MKYIKQFVKLVYIKYKPGEDIGIDDVEIDENLTS